ncbi:hypothetical protein Tco_0446558, partial [Tanacetum coccineum]
ISLYLFALILDELLRGIQEDIPWCLIFADDIVLVSESTEALISPTTKKWRFVLETRSYNLNESFRHIGSMIHRSWRIEEEVSHLIKATWLKWRADTSVLCNRNASLKLKENSIEWQLDPLCCTGQSASITKALANRVEVTELRMLRWTCSKTMLDMILNGVYRAELEVESIINVETRRRS